MSRNARIAADVTATAVEMGAGNFVICAGARNVPLIAALTSMDARTARLWHHFDERSASFFALGLARTLGEPVAVVTTSGTAAAELLPAVIEAWYSGQPLILLTADRPARFRGSGAPQAIEQSGLFYGYVSQFHDLGQRLNVEPLIRWDQASPIHFNVCFEEPEPEGVVPGEAFEFSLERNSPFPALELLPRLQKPIALVAEVPPGDRAQVVSFLTSTRMPAWFEATSGLREEPLLASQRIDQEKDIANFSPLEVLRIGGVPSCRFWRDLDEKFTSIHVINLARGNFRGLGRTDRVDSLDFSKLPHLTGFNVSFNRVPSPTVPCSIEEFFERHPHSEPARMRQLSEMIPSEASIFLGNSLPLREWNLAATKTLPHPWCHANRGANGIDGELSTFLGISCGHRESWGVFGDLTALYDLNAPWILAQMDPKAKVRFVIFNNGGGRIFSRLPAMRRLGPETTKLTENHHQVEFSHWAAMWNLEYLRCAPDASEIPVPRTSRAVIEIAVDQEKSEAFWKEYNAI